MSNHSVGHAINEVTRGIYNRYLNKEIDKKTAKDLINLCYRCSSWDDGNNYEGVECLEDCVCGVCLKIIDKGKPLYSYYEKIDEEYSCNRKICSNCLTTLQQEEKITEEEVERVKENGYESRGVFYGKGYSSGGYR